MFEQSMLLDSASGKKAGALAVSLTVQTLAAGTLLLIPLVYTDHLPFSQLQLPTFLPLAPPLPHPPKAIPAQPSRTHSLTRRVLTMPTRVPPLNTQPEIIDNAPSQDMSITMGPAIAIPAVLDLPRALPPPPEPHVFAATPSKPLTVSSEIQAAKLLRKIVPVYPRVAIVARISGTVRLLGTVGADGTIQEVQVLGGPGLLVQAAVDAVRQWVYRPTLLNGKPVEVTAPIDVNFTLSQ
jgi:protein TonB